MEKYYVVKSNDKSKPEFLKFPSSKFDKEQIASWLSSHDIKNFFFFCEPQEPIQFGDNSTIINGEVGFDITTESFVPLLESGKEILLNTYGGDLYEGWRTHDLIKYSKKEPSIGVLGVCASSGIQILLATENRWGTENSRFLVHNPWTYTVGDDEALLSEAKELTMEKTQLANKYAQISGKTVEEMLALMKEERMLSAQEALELNLIKEIKSSTNLQTKKEDEKMTKEESEKVDGIMNKVEQLWNKLFPKPIKNMDITDVNGNQFHVVREEGEIQVGDEASPDGSFTVEDGKTIVIEGGKITAINEPAKPVEDVEALKKENETLKSEIERLKASKTDLSEKLEAFNKAKVEMDTIVGELRDYKSKVVIQDRKQNFTPKTSTAKSLDIERYNELDKKLTNK